VTSLTADDRLEIAEVMARWAAFEDGGQAEAWAGLFTADGVSTSASGKHLTGHAALAGNARTRWNKPGGQDVAHIFAAPVIEPSTEGAIARHYGVLVDRAGAVVLGVLSRRTCHLRREDGRWRIFYREIEHLTKAGSSVSGEM